MSELARRRVPKRWTEEEDQILYEEAQKQSTTGLIKDWNSIATRLPGRTNKDCRKRWVNKVRGCLKKGAWNDEEDERLLRGVRVHGQKWTLVANEVGYRSPDQCAKRWQYSLDPKLDHAEWTAEEDTLLLASVQKHGREWKFIQELSYPTRSRNDLKNRFTILSRRMSHSRGSVSEVGSSTSDQVSSPGTTIIKDEFEKPMEPEIPALRPSVHLIPTAQPQPSLHCMTGPGATESWVNIGGGDWLEHFSPATASPIVDMFSGAHRQHHIQHHGAINAGFPPHSSGTMGGIPAATMSNPNTQQNRQSYSIPSEHAPTLPSSDGGFLDTSMTDGSWTSIMAAGGTGASGDQDGRSAHSAYPNGSMGEEQQGNVAMSWSQHQFQPEGLHTTTTNRTAYFTPECRSDADDRPPPSALSAPPSRSGSSSSSSSSNCSSGSAEVETVPTPTMGPSDEQAVSGEDVPIRRVSLLVEQCDRDTLNYLIDVTSPLRGKVKLEISA